MPPEVFSGVWPEHTLLIFCKIRMHQILKLHSFLSETQPIATLLVISKQTYSQSKTPTQKSVLALFSPMPCCDTQTCTDMLEAVNINVSSLNSISEQSDICLTADTTWKHHSTRSSIFCYFLKAAPPQRSFFSGRFVTMKQVHKGTVWVRVRSG